MKQQLLVSKADKKKIMSLDLAERLIRVEQNVSACFNKPVSFTQTEYFKSMSNSEKKDFIKYLNNKTKKKVFKLFLVFLPLLIIFLLNMSITGKAIKETIGESYFIGAEILVVVLFDDLVHEGIPRGSSILVEGGPGSGKTLFCLNLAKNMCEMGKKVLYMSFEEPEERLMH